MIPTFTQQELAELKLRFNNIEINESLSIESDIITLSSGRVVTGNITENGVLQVKNITNFLCG